MKKILSLFILITVSACGAVLKNPEINDAEFEKELKHQQELLESYKRKNRVKARNKKMKKNIWAYDNYFGVQFDKMLLANRDFCKHKMYTAGIRFSEISNGKHKGKKAVHGVTKGFPAYKSGVRAGDLILAINDNNSPSYENIEDSFAKNKVNKVTYFSKQSGMEQNVKITGFKTCQMLLYTSSDSRKNAFADGKAIYMFPALYNFLGKDEYINTVIAHEIAHNIMAHPSRSELNSVAGQLAGLGAALLLGGNARAQEDFMTAGHNFAQGYSPEFEAEADYMGLYIMARAGYSIKNTANTWRRMTMLSTKETLGMDTTHPATPKRFIALKKAIAEINKKKKAGKKLIPDFQADKWKEFMDWERIKSMQKSVY